LIILAGSSGVEKSILERIRGVVFFGVLAFGMEMSHLLALIQGQPNEPLVKALAREANYLTLLDSQFRGSRRKGTSLGSHAVAQRFAQGALCGSPKTHPQAQGQSGNAHPPGRNQIWLKRKIVVINPGSRE
jgi:hypothetical protein